MNREGSIILFGNEYSKGEIIELCNNKLESEIEEWEKEIFRFILEWHNQEGCLEVSTSGSTGPPKKISLKKVYVEESALSTISYFELKPGNTVWLCLPMKYIASKLMVVRAIAGKLNLVYSKPGSFPSISIDNIEFTAMVPLQVINLLESQSGIKTLKKVKKLLIGGSSISNVIEEKLIDNNIMAWHSYGMTETITHIALRKMGVENKYYPLKDVVLSVNDHNQLIINYPLRGIINMITNDIVKLEKDQSFEVVGRFDNVIITGGIKVYPEKIENVLTNYIDDSFFIAGIDDEKLGQKVVLVVENPNNNIKLDRIQDVLQNNFSKYELPREIIVLDKFEYTETAKISRNKTLLKVKK